MTFPELIKAIEAAGYNTKAVPSMPWRVEYEAPFPLVVASDSKREEVSSLYGYEFLSPGFHLWTSLGHYPVNPSLDLWVLRSPPRTSATPKDACPKCGDAGEWRTMALVCRQGHGPFIGGPLARVKV